MYQNYPLALKRNINRDLYDHDLEDHHILLMDWTSGTGVEDFAKMHHEDSCCKPVSILVNGFAANTWKTFEVTKVSPGWHFIKRFVSVFH